MEKIMLSVGWTDKKNSISNMEILNYAFNQRFPRSLSDLGGS